MKKTLMAIIIILFVLAACSPQPEMTDDQMATRVAQILTEEYIEPTQTEKSPAEVIISTETVEESEEPPESVVVVSPTATETVPPPTPTETKPPTATSTPTEVPTNTPEPTVTPPDSDPSNILGVPASIDMMDNADVWHWPTGVQEYTAIEFENGYMALTGRQDVAGWRLPMASAGTDMYIEMVVRTGECIADDSYGIIFRVPVFHEADRGYLFSVSCDGAYRLTKWDGKAGENGQGWRLLDWRASVHINPGPEQVNRIGVMTYGNRFYLFANGYLLNDSFILEDYEDPYPGGHFGVFVAAKNTPDFTIYVDQMSYWLNSYKP